MIAIARTDDTVQISDGNEGTIEVPDLKIPQQVEWNAYKISGQSAFIVTFETDTKKATTLWHGPHVLQDGFTYYIIDAPKRVLQILKNQLGVANVAPLIKALRARPALRAWVKANNFRVIRNTAGNPVSVMPPLVIAGTNPRDLDEEDLDAAQELLDLE